MSTEKAVEPEGSESVVQVEDEEGLVCNLLEPPLDLNVDAPAPQYLIKYYYFSSHNFNKLGNIPNILRYLYGITRLITETTSYKRKCGTIVRK